MPDFSKQFKVLDEELVYEKVKQISIQVFYSIIVNKDVEEALSNIGDEIKWNGSGENFLAENKEKLRELFVWKCGTMTKDSQMKVIRSDVFSLNKNCYSSSGEIEVRMPYQEEIEYTTLRFMMSIVQKRGKLIIQSVQTSEINHIKLDKSQNLLLNHSENMANDTARPEHYDYLTGLFTLDYFKEMTVLFLQHANTYKHYALLYTDITNFEKLNNLYGLQKADEVLLELAGMITAFDKKVVYCCRSVADHFLLLLECDDHTQIQRLATMLCHQFDEAIKGNFPHASLRLGVGIYELGDVTIGIDEMVEHANVARKTLRSSATNRVAFYDKTIFMQVEKVKHIEKNMQKALESGEFQVFLQPKYNLINGDITGAEALVRWIRPDGSMIYPDEFVPVFEKNGFIEQVDYYMLEQICSMIQRRREQKKKCLPISINQSRILLSRKDYTTRIAKVLLKYQTPPQLIELELTERLFSNHYDEMYVMMEQLKKVGIKWSIDDFGTGYSSLNLLKELPVDIVKLDKSFLDETETSEVSRVIIRKIVELTKELQKSIVCEGVETKEQADYLRTIRCDMAQGYLYARPMPMSNFEKLIDKKVR